MSGKLLGVRQMTITKAEFERIVKCEKDIEHMKETISEIKKKIKDFHGDKKENVFQVTNKKLMILLIIATLIGGTLSGVAYYLLFTYT